MDTIIYAPWTPEQVAALKRWQANPGVHPMTCDNRHLKETMLVPTRQGWRCRVDNCSYSQNWAHKFMFVEPSNQPLLDLVGDE